MTVISCFLEHDGKIFVLARHNSKSNRYEWDIPADKVHDNESKEAALIRILEVEANYKLSMQDPLLLGSFQFVSGNNEEYTMLTYKVQIDKAPEATSSDVRTMWVKPDECLLRNDLIKNLDTLIKAIT